MLVYSIESEILEIPMDYFNPSEATLKGMREFEPGRRYLKYNGKITFLSEEQIKEIGKLIMIEPWGQSEELKNYFDGLVR